MAKLNGLDYFAFPFDKLGVEAGELTWCREFEDSPVEGFDLEFKVPAVPLPGDDPDDGYRAMEDAVALSLSVRHPFVAIGELEGKVIDNNGLPATDCGGNIYLGSRHHDIDVLRIAFRDLEADRLQVDVSCRVFFTHGGLGAGEKCEFDDTDWNFSAPVVVQDEIHTYRTGQSPSMLSRAISAAGNIFRSKG